MFGKSNYLLFLAYCMLIAFSTPAFGEIRVGYSSFTSSSKQVSSELSRKRRVTDQYSITGKNVIPTNDKKVFSRNTEWKVLEKDQKFKLVVVDENPTIDFSSTKTSSEIVQSSRKESISSSISGFESTSTRRSLSPFSRRSLPPVIPVSTSVFDF